MAKEFKAQLNSSREKVERLENSLSEVKQQNQILSNKVEQTSKELSARTDANRD